MYRTGERSPIPVNPNYLKLKQLIEIAREVGQADTPWFKGTVERLSASWNESIYQNGLDTLIRCYRQPLLDNTFKIPANDEDLDSVAGKYKIGTIEGTDIEFGFDPIQLQMHGVIGGQSGFGKSTLIKILEQQIMAEGKIRTWLIDPKEGGDYRFLARQFQNALVLRPDVMRLNPFNMIKNVPVKMLRESISEVTADSFAVYDASESVITEHVQRIFEEHEQPNLYDFINSVWSEKVRFGGRRSGYLDTIKSRLTKIQSSMEDIVNCRTDYFSELYDRDVVFEIGSLSGNAQRILVPWLIMKLVLYKIKNPTPYLSHLLVFDEAQAQIWSRYLEMRGRQSYMATLATQARAYGLGLLVLCQEPNMKLMREITANSCIKIAFHLGDGDEVQGFGRSMGLNYEQMDKIHHFKRGEVICRVGLGYTEPIRLDLYNFQDEPVSDAELEELMRPKYDALLEGIEPATRDRGIAERPGRKQVAAKPAALLTPKPSSDEELYLRVVHSRPWRLITEIYDTISDEKIMGTEAIGKTRAGRARKSLAKTGYLESFAVTETGKSGRPQCDILTEKAGMGSVEHPRGGNLHSWWCYRVGCFFRDKGDEVKLGSSESGNEIDIGILMDGQNLGIEIVITGLVADNLPKHLSHFDRVLILCAKEKKKEMEKLVGGLSPDVQMKVEVGLLKDYFIPL